MTDLLSEVDEIEYPVPAEPTDEDVECAQKAVVIHQGVWRYRTITSLTDGCGADAAILPAKAAIPLRVPGP
jgi:hypothetical protein